MTREDEYGQRFNMEFELEVGEKSATILTAWILRAERRQIPYSLEMPTDALPAELGEEHMHACLKILALFNQ